MPDLYDKSVLTDKFIIQNYIIKAQDIIMIRESHGRTFKTCLLKDASLLNLRNSAEHKNMFTITEKFVVTRVYVHFFFGRGLAHKCLSHVLQFLRLGQGPCEVQSAVVEGYMRKLDRADKPSQINQSVMSVVVIMVFGE